MGDLEESAKEDAIKKFVHDEAEKVCGGWAKLIKAMLDNDNEAWNKRFGALRNAMFQYLELSSSMGLSAIKANLKTI